MLIGTYERGTAVGALLLEHLPAELVLPGLDLPVAGLLGREVVRDEPGQSAVLDRLLDLLLVSVLRTALPRGELAPSDPAVRGALRAMHEHPERPWTVQALAHAAGLSRAAFARRFAEAVGEPPLGHLTRWRLALAADLLAGTELTLGAIAARVGYADAFALSAAFKRRYGAPPSRYRATAS
jgi:transcriptional regulator GlxA family with amidase domain